MPKNKVITNYYFARFARINAVILVSLLITRIFLIQEAHILAVYILMLLGLVVYARINFELLRPYAGVGTTLLIFWFLRIVLIFTVKNPIGVFSTIPAETLEMYYRYLTNLYVIEFVNLLGGGGIFFFIFDMYLGTKKMQISQKIENPL